MAPITKSDPLFHYNFYKKTNAAYKFTYGLHIDLTKKLLQQAGFHNELRQVLETCLRTFEAKIRLLELLVPEAPMVYGKPIDNNYTYGDEGYDDAEVCLMSVLMLKSALAKSGNDKTIFDSTEAWSKVRREVLRIQAQQAAVGAAEIFKRQLEEKLAADRADLETMLSK